jgi:hypothetical protein
LGNIAYAESVSCAAQAELIGREVESGLIDELVDGLPDAGGALIVRGEAGIGKSALLERSEAEQKLVWATHMVPDVDLFNQKVEGTAWRSKPSWYIVARNDRTVHPELERSRREANGRNHVRGREQSGADALTAEHRS